ncbi:TetR/AcrR family transcriptional regulator [Salinibacterium sp. ZJ454]|uniref:TetR/AcrR family transcriptional regulator n=1 Tax=Salinibacterium sp. ZJ454 TaxID=2708339 RepID=UPI001423A31C|nr:TetR/AcrR family transcriptional regulator [Salinibacterium sp. ZJ454]
MAVDFPPSTAQPAPGAKVRILETADRLFYLEGINGVGVDRLISESAVTKATFYKHYGAKDSLILAYIRGRSAAMRDRFEQIAAAHTPDDTIRRIFRSAGEEITEPGFRGCAFTNAAVEFARPAHPVRLIVAEHREWFTDFLVERLRALGHPLPGDAADDLQLAYDGAMTGGYAGDPIAASVALSRAVDRVLESVPAVV